jgi:hypothetical protein
MSDYDKVALALFILGTVIFFIGIISWCRDNARRGGFPKSRKGGRK